MNKFEFRDLETDQFIALGEGTVAYVKQMSSEDIKRAFPQVSALEPGMRFYALLSASGQPILLADTEDAAISNAWENELMTMPLH